MKVSIEYPDQEVWDALVGADFAGTTDFAKAIRFESWSEPGDIQVQNYEGQWTVITWDEITSIFGSLVSEGATHCGEYSYGNLNWSDACLAYTVLSRAVEVEGRTWTDEKPEV